jgi:hypothetical protein
VINVIRSPWLTRRPSDHRCRSVEPNVSTHRGLIALYVGSRSGWTQ